MTANQVKIYATPEAYNLLENAKDENTIRIFKALKEMVVDGDTRCSGHGAGFDCPIAIAAEWQKHSGEPSVILLYKRQDSSIDNYLGTRMRESRYYSDNLPELIESAIPISFD